MTQAAFERGDWQAVINAHPLESHDPQEWLRYGVALLQTISLCPDGAKQQQQAALAFVQAQKEGAPVEAVAAAQRHSVMLSLSEALCSAGLEQASLAAQERCAAIQHWEGLRLQASEALMKGEWQAAQALVSDWITSPEGRTPDGVDAQTYTELLLNACCRGDQQLPLLWLIESRSLPRSGHHFLKSLLEHAWGEDFSYCEGYQEPGCCQASPCSVVAYWHFAREHQRPHLRLLKSHDFALSDATFDPLPGMLRLIQVRRPFDLLVSWLELEQLTLNRDILNASSIVLERIFLYHEPELLEEAWRVVDQGGSVMAPEQVQEWLEDKVSYIVSFLRKWLPLASPLPLADHLKGDNILLRYEDLTHWQQLLKALGRDDLKPEQFPTFAPRHQLAMKRRSTRVTELAQANRALLLQADANVMEEVPAMQELYPQPVNDQAADLTQTLPAVHTTHHPDQDPSQRA